MYLQNKEFYDINDVIEIIRLCDSLHEENKHLKERIQISGSKLSKSNNELNKYKTKCENQTEKLKELQNAINKKQKPKLDKKLQVKISQLQNKLSKQENDPNHPKGIKMQCTGKVRYDSMIDAENALGAIQRTSNRRTIPIRKYKCTYCGGYHLTSKQKVRDHDLKVLDIAKRSINKSV